MLSSSETIRRIRVNMGLNQDEFARELGITKSAVSKYESKQRSPKTNIIRKLKDLADKNNIEVKYEDFFEK